MLGSYNFRKIKSYFTRVAVALTVVMVAAAAFTFRVNAAVSAVSVTGTDFTGSSIDISTVTTATATIAYTTATSLTGGDTIIITLNGLHPDTNALVVADLTFDGPGGTNCSTGIAPVLGAPGATQIGTAFSNNVAGTDGPIITFTLGSSVSCNAGTFNLDLLTASVASSATAGNYAITVVTSEESGAGFLYVGDENDVLITASVDPILTFTIRNSADTTDLPNVDGGAVGPSLCNLGTLSTGSVASCSYRLKVATNADGGYAISVVVDDDLNLPADTDFINNTATGSAPSAGTEGYNILLAAGAITSGGTVTECDGSTITGSCAADGINWANATGTIFNNTSTSVMINADGPNAPSTTDTTNTSLVTHRAAISAATPAGVYNQLVTYTVAPNF